MGDLLSPDGQSQANPPNKILLAMHRVMQEVFGVAKDRKNAHQGFSFTGHDDVTFVLRPAFVKHGIVQLVNVVGYDREGITATTKRGEETDSVVCAHVAIRWIAVEDGSWYEAHSYGEASLKGTTPDLQSGKAVSYAVKVAQLKTFMLLGGYADPEPDAGAPERAPEREHKRSEPPPRSTVTDEYIAELVNAYAEVTEKTGLDRMRKVVSGIARDVTEAQYDLLRLADEGAVARGLK